MLNMACVHTSWHLYLESGATSDEVDGKDTLQALEERKIKEENRINVYQVVVANMHTSVCDKESGHETTMTRDGHYMYLTYCINTHNQQF